MSVSDYDARWIELLNDAGRKEITIPFEELRHALNFRQKIYRLRTAMRKERENPPKTYTKEQWYKIIESADKASGRIVFVFKEPGKQEKIYINNLKTPPPDPSELKAFNKEKKEGPVLLILKPQDLDYHDILTDAGYAVPELDL